MQAIEALKRRYGCRVVAPVKARGEVPAADAYVRRATRRGSAAFRPMCGKRRAIAWIMSPIGLRLTGRCLPATPCSRSAAGGSSNGTYAEMWSSLQRLAALPDEARVYCGHDYVALECRFALAAEPDNAALKARMAEAEKAKTEGRFLMPSTIGAGEGDEPLPARGRARSPAPSRWRRDAGRGLSGVARMEEPVLIRKTILPGADSLMKDHSLIIGLESRLLNAWPSFDYQLYDGWVLRLANGYSKRANSATPFRPDIGLDDELIDYMVARFVEANCGRPSASTAWRHPMWKSCSSSAASRISSRRMCSPLRIGADNAESDPEVNLEPQVSKRWVREAAKSYGGDKADDETLMRIVSRIRQKTAFATLSLDDRPVAWGLGVVERGYIGLYDIVVSPDLRGIGLGRRVVSSLMAWGRGQGAHTAYLQVREENEIARSLYEAFGFSIAYRYTHRVMPGGLPGHQRRHQRAGHDEPAGERQRQGRLCIARDHQEQGREHRRRIGSDAEEADVAPLHADVPDIEGRSDRPEPEPENGKPLHGRFRPHRGLESEMADEAQERGREAEAGHRSRSAPGRNGGRAPNSRPRRRPRRRRRDSLACTRPRIEGAAPGDQHDHAGKAEKRADDMRAPQMLARQKRGEQHDQERPEIVISPDSAGGAKRKAAK